ncbi:AMP-binding protein, partial [Streptomyces sp. SA3_actF]|uniref:AMP-binding protein n=1 Tax=Streptomyces sp. SA3_actF TaxID=682181 RepID=UPI001F176193
MPRRHRAGGPDPHALALHGDGFALTYGELDARARRIAHRLRALGAGPETRVAVLLDRGPDLVAALLGVWKAGAAQVPLDPGTPAPRPEEAGIALAVTEAAYAGRLPGVPYVPAAETQEAGDGPGAALDAVALDAVPLDPDRLAYVLHTSGSTGGPKAVEISHRALAHYLDWAVTRYTTAGTGGAPWFTPVGFDLGMPALWAPLMTGQAVRVLPRELAPGDLGARLLAGAPYAFVGLTPGHLRLLEDQLTDEELASLAGLAVCAGDAYPAAQA